MSTPSECAPRAAIIVMPFASEDGPSLGPSLLRASLAREGIPCDLLYLNLHFAAAIGLEHYRAVDEVPTMLLGEWIFASSLFGGRASSAEDFVRRVVAPGDPDPAELISNLDALRKHAERFIEAAPRRWRLDDYDVVGFSSTFQQNVASLALAKKLKGSRPDRKIVFGGANVEGVMGAQMLSSFPFVDAVISGEAEESLPRLIAAWCAEGDANGIAGVFTMDGQSSHASIENLDALPSPDFSDYFSQLKESGLALSPRATHLRFETARGCWWGEKVHCSFCGLNGDGISYRKKSVTRIHDELTRLESYPTRSILVCDNIAPRDFDWLKALAASNSRFRLFLEVKSPMTHEALKLLAAAGCRRIQPGIESLSSSALARMKKGTRAIDNIALLKWAMEESIESTWNLLSLRDGKEALEAAASASIIPLLHHLQPPTGIFEIQVHRFSPIFENPASFGIGELAPVPAYAAVYPLESEAVSKLAYYFEPLEKRAIDGLAPLIEAVEAWKLAATAGRSSCVMADDGSVLVVRDARGIAEPVVHRIRGPERELLLAAHAPVAAHDVLERCGSIRDRGIMNAIASTLLSKKLLLQLDDMFLTLPLLLDHDELRSADELEGAGIARAGLLKSFSM